MSNSGKQSPLGVNTLSSLLSNTGVNINPVMVNTYGYSTSNTSYTLGSIIGQTSLKYLTYAINDAYTRGQVSTTVYNTLLTIGASTVPALGNAPASIFYNYTGYPNWASNYNNTNAVTQWGFIRLFALQGYNEFNYNNGLPNYAEYLNAFMTASSFVKTTNQSIMTMQNSLTFLDGTFSNLDDLITADISGVSLSTVSFGKDLISLGKAFDLSTISTFGLPTDVLKLLKKYNAISSDVSLALISSGLDINLVNSYIAGTQIADVNQQKLVFSALQLIVGDSLAEVLTTLNCKTTGFESLADLLNVRKLFPTSYDTLTVPVYNTIQSPNNSKTYYPIFVNGALNPNLSTPSVVAQVGSQFPLNAPELGIDSQTGLVQEIPLGFGSFLYSILPKDLAISCGAFSSSMQQIKNISSIPFEKFAQVVFSLETMQGLNTNSTTVPVDTTLVSTQLPSLALGSGPYGTYTISDFFGCMNGLPYVGRDIEELIIKAQTPTLETIYKNLYLATQWEAATVTVSYTTYLSGATTYYKVTGVNITDAGGGYGRGNASAPTITISGGSGATAVATIGTDSSNLGTNGNGTYGRVTSISLTSSGTDTTTIPTVTIQAPPTTTEGTNTASGTVGWPTMNTVVSSYITQANSEISTINTNNISITSLLNTQWTNISTQLTVEQRAIATGLPIQVPYTGDPQVTATSPTAQITFVDSVPQFALNTQPNMEAQSLEAVADLCTPGGNSLVGMMRETRNQARLATIGIELDNNIPDTITETEQKELLGNGSIPGTTSAPSSLKQVDCTTGEEVQPQSAGFYDSTTNNFVTTNPNYGEANQPVDTGSTNVPGSFAGSEYAGLLPPNLNVFYTSNTLLPATYNISNAIDQVITCNCDCWELI